MGGARGRSVSRGRRRGRLLQVGGTAVVVVGARLAGDRACGWNSRLFGVAWSPARPAPAGGAAGLSLFVGARLAGDRADGWNSRPFGVAWSPVEWADGCLTPARRPQRRTARGRFRPAGALPGTGRRRLRQDPGPDPPHRLAQ